MSREGTKASTSAAAYLAGLARLFEQVEAGGLNGERLSFDAAIERAVEIVEDAKTAGRKVLLIGNGGSAAVVSHMQNDLCKAVGVRAIVFTEPPLLTALANDDGYQTAFRQQVELWAERDDVMIAVSSSGESENIVSAVEAARRRGCHVITFSGFMPSNRLRRLGAVNVYVPSNAYGYVEMSHSTICHCITDSVAARSNQ